MLQAGPGGGVTVEGGGEGIEEGVEDKGSDGSERMSCESNLFQTWLSSRETLRDCFSNQGIFP